MAEEKPVSFAADVRPLFRDIDVEHMGDFGVMLHDYAYMSQTCERGQRVGGPEGRRADANAAARPVLVG